MDYKNQIVSLDILKETIETFKGVYSTATFDEKRVLLSGLIKKIEVYQDNVDIYFFNLRGLL